MGFYWKSKTALSSAILGVSIGILLSAPRETRAESFKSNLETIGISTAMGTVLGASTLPFYDQPKDHFSNLGYGALLGAVLGVGIAAYGWITGTSSAEQSFAAASHPEVRGSTNL